MAVNLGRLLSHTSHLTPDKSHNRKLTHGPRTPPLSSSGRHAMSSKLRRQFLFRHDARVQTCCSNSVRYFGASAAAFALNSDCAAPPNSGGGVVRVATGTPISMKNSS